MEQTDFQNTDRAQVPSRGTRHGSASSRKRLDLNDLPTEAEQERRWEQDICVMCGAEPIAGDTYAARYCGPACRQHMTALKQKALRRKRTQECPSGIR